MPASTTPMPHAGIMQLEAYVPGKSIEDLKREYGLDSIIKLASNENPLGTGAAARTALADFDGALYRYPDGAGRDIKAALSARHEVATDGITLGNGSDDVLELIARVFLGPGRNAVVSKHAFAVYPIVTQAVNAELREVAALDAEAPMPYGHDLEAMLAAVDSDTRVVFMASPNNPTGTWFANAELEDFLARLPAHVVVVLDQAYIEYQTEPAPPVADWLARFPNLIVTRTFSKIHGLAALRFGYGLSSREIADYLNRVRGPFNVNALALHCATAALGDEDFIAHSIATNTAQRAALARELDARGLSCLPSQGNFLTFDAGVPQARSVFEALLAEGVILRPLAGYGLPRHLRVTVGDASDNARFLAALDRISSR